MFYIVEDESLFILMNLELKQKVVQILLKYRLVGVGQNS